MFTHLLREHAQPNTGEVVYGEPRNTWIVSREQPIKTRPENFIFQSLLQFR